MATLPSKGPVINCGGGGGATKREGGGGVKLTLQKEKGGGGSAMLKGGTKRFGVVLKWELEVLAIRKGGAKSFPLLKGESGGGGSEKF